MKKSYNLITKTFFQVILACLLTGSLLAQGSVSGTVRYSDNNMPVFAGTVKAFDLNGIELANTQIQSDGTYLLANLPPVQTDMIGLVDDEWGDFISTFHPDKEDWQSAVSVIPLGNLNNIDIYVTRTNHGAGNMFSAHISGNVTLNGAPLKDAIVYAQVDGISKQCGRTDELGNYVINGLSERDYILVVHRIGCTSDQKVVNVNLPGVDKVNFNLEKASKRESSSIIKEFKLSQNYPNPFNPSTKISFTLPSAGNVKITVYNITGQVVRVLVNEYKDAGSYTTEFNGESLSSGVYYYRLEYKGFTETRKMTMVK